MFETKIDISRKNDYFIVVQKIGLSKKERLVELCKTIGLGSLALLSGLQWTSAIKLTQRSWKRAFYGIGHYRARIDQSFLRTGHVIQGVLRQKKLVAKKFRQLLNQPLREKPATFMHLPDSVLLKIMDEYFMKWEIKGLSGVNKQCHQAVEKLRKQKLQPAKLYAESIIRTLDPLQFASFIKKLRDILETKTFEHPYCVDDEYTPRIQAAASFLFSQHTDALKNNLEVVKAAISIYPKDFNLASDEIKASPELVGEIVSQSGWVLELVSNELKNNREVVKAAISKYGKALQYGSTELKNDAEIVKIAVAIDGLALQFASIELKNDAEIVKIAVAQNGESLEFASTQLKNDAEVVKIAVAQNGLALRFASADLQNNVEIVKIAAAENFNSLIYISAVLQANKQIFLAAVSKYGDALRYALRTLRNDKDVVLAAVSNNGFALYHASYALQDDFEVVKAAVSQNGQAIMHASQRLKNHSEIYQIAVKMEPSIFKYASLKTRLLNPKTTYAAIKYCNRF